MRLERTVPDPIYCSAMVVDAGATRRKRCPQPAVFRWRAFELPMPGIPGAPRVADETKPPSAEGYACTMHRDTSHLPDGKSSASWRGKFSLRLSLLESVR